MYYNQTLRGEYKMANTKLTKTIELYNADIKNQYLDTFDNETTRKISERPLQRSSETERSLGKDLYEMTISEIEDVMYGLECSSLNAVYNNAVKIEEYIDWTIVHGFRQSNINPLSSLKKYEWGKTFISKYKNYAFTKEELDEMIQDLVNHDDRAILMLLFEGVSGDGFNEILTLKYSEETIEESQTPYITVKNKDGSERDVTISRELATELRLANNNKIYINKNGEAKEAHFHTSALEESPYIFRKTVRGKQGGGTDITYIQRKFLLFKEVFGLKHLKATHIQNSGMMHIANELADEDGVLSHEAMQEIAERFDVTFTTTKETRYRNLTLVKRVIEQDLFEKIYGYKMSF